MRNIKKGTEPRTLTEHRCKQHADYDNYADKDDLRESLVAEQRGICCYCLRRIEPKLTKMKIEHWRSQSKDKYPELQLVYSNLLGACPGGADRSGEAKHCDTSKGDQDLKLNPSDPAQNVEAGFHYLGDGRVKADDARFDQDINTVLNLNNGSLVKNRKGILDAFRQVLISTGPSNTDLKKHLNRWNGAGGGELAPYCQVVVYYLKKKLKVAA